MRALKSNTATVHIDLPEGKGKIDTSPISDNINKTRLAVQFIGKWLTL